MWRKNERTRLLDSGPRTCFFVQAAFATSFTYLTGGVFLSGLAMLMGAGDMLFSYLSVIVNICGVLVLAFSAFLERFQSRKRLTIGLTVLSKLATLFIVAIPVLVPFDSQLILFIPAVIVAFTLQAQATVVLNQWMLGFVDETKSGRYISLRQTLTLIVTVILSLSSGYWMDVAASKYLGFVLLFAVAALMGVCEIILLARTPDSEAYHSSGEGRKMFRGILRIPLSDRRFVGFVVYILFFYLLLNISDSFTTAYMMRHLELPYQTITALNMIISLPQVVLLGVWGRISDRRRHDFVLKSSIWLFVGETLFMAFASQRTWFVFIPIAFLIASVENAGFVVAVFNRRYELIPVDNRIVYDNFYSAAIGIGFILGPMIGGFIKGGLEAGPVAKSAIPFMNIRLLYLISTAAFCYCSSSIYDFRKKECRRKNKGGRITALVFMPVHIVFKFWLRRPIIQAKRFSRPGSSRIAKEKPDSAARPAIFPQPLPKGFPIEKLQFSAHSIPSISPFAFLSFHCKRKMGRIQPLSCVFLPFPLDFTA